MIKRKTIINIILILLILWIPAAAECGTAEYILEAAPVPGSASIGGEWGVIGVVRGGHAPEGYKDAYIGNLRDRLSGSSGDLGRKYTEYARAAIALNALGLDPHSFAGYNLFERINNFDAVTRQGINGVIFALEAKLICDDSDLETENRYIEYILSRQSADGSFALTEGRPDTDVTAMAVSALCLSEQTEGTVRAINRAMLYLSRVQMPGGGFAENAGAAEPSCESTAQVIIAMRRYGLAEDDRFFVKNGHTAMEALAAFMRPDGGSAHLMSDAGSNLMSSEQTLLALTEPQSTVRTLIYDRIWFEARNGL